MIGKLYNFPEYFLAYRMWDNSSSFTHQRQNAKSAIKIVRRYRHDYPGYALALMVAWGHLIYSYLPAWVRRRANVFMSRFKKFLFAK
jgi:hypothetical protein